MVVIIKCKDPCPNMTYTKHAVDFYLEKYPNVKRITLDLNNPDYIIAYSKGDKDTIKLRRKPNG